MSRFALERCEVSKKFSDGRVISWGELHRAVTTRVEHPVGVLPAGARRRAENHPLMGRFGRGKFR